MTPESHRQQREITRGFSWSLPVALLLVAVGCGHGRSAGGQPPNSPAYAAPARTESAEGVVLDTPDPHEAVKDPEEALDLIGRQATAVERELRAARDTGDPRTIDCIDDKLSQIHAQERLGREQSKLLDRAHKNSDTTREHEARVMIGVARDRAQRLGREANRCGGTVSNGQTVTNVEIERFGAASADPPR